MLFRSYSVTRIIRDPLITNRIYCGTTSGLLKSDSNGKKWTFLFKTPNGLPFGIAINPHDSNELYVGFYKSSTGTFGNPGIYRSTDGGLTWKAINDGLTNLNITDIKIDPFDPSNVYAATYGGGVFKTTTKGKLGWQCISDSLREKYILTLELSQTDSQTIYVGTRRGIFKSENGGSSWQDMNSPIFKNKFVRSLLVSFSGDTLLMGTDNGLCRTLDGGRQWEEVDENLDIKAIHSMVKGYDGSIYCGTPEGVYRSYNWGGTWTKMPLEMQALSVNDMAFDTIMTPPHIWIGTDGAGLYLGSDSEDHWQAYHVADGFNNIMNCIARDSLIIANVIVPDSLKYAKSRLFKGRIAESDWTDISAPIADKDFFTSIAINPQNEQEYFAGTNKSLIFKTRIGGLRWEQKSNGILNGESFFSILKIFPKDTNIVFASANFRKSGLYGFYRSEDGGDNWVPRYFGLPVHFIANELAIHPRAADTLFLAMGPYLIYSSFNGGLTWHPSFNGIPSSGAEREQDNLLNLENVSSLREPYLQYDPLTGNYLSNKSQWKGSLYQTINDSITPIVHSIDIDPDNPRVLYASVSLINSYLDSVSNEIFQSRDGGQTWHSIIRALPWQYGLRIRLEPHNSKRLYAYNNSGLYVIDLTKLSVPENVQKTPPRFFKLFQNYPNPFNPTTTIRYQLPEAEYVTVAIYDLQGRLVETLVDGEKAAGRYSVTWHAENQPSGVYFYRIRAGKFTATKKLLLLK